MYCYQHFTVLKTEKFEDFDDVFQLRTTTKRIGRREKLLIQNKCGVSSQKHRMKKQEGATAAATPTFPHSGLTRLSFVGRKASSTEEVQTIGKYS